MRTNVTWAILILFAGILTSANVHATTLAYYPLGEAGSLGANNDPIDIVNGHDFQNNFGGAAGVVSGLPVSTDALSFTPTQGYYYTNADFVPADNFSIEIWAKTSNIAQTSNFFNLGETGAFLTLGIDSGYWFAGDFGVDYIGASPGTSPAAQAAVADTWTRLGLARVNGLTTFYINGSAIGSQATYSASVNGGSKMHLGFLPFAANPFNGVLDELRLTLVPEPATISLFGVGAAGLIRLARRKQKVRASA